MTALPDWLVERIALDEVPPASRARISGIDPQALAERLAALRADNAVELAAYPAAPAVAQLEARIAAEAKRRTAARRRKFASVLGALGTVAAIVVLVLVTRTSTETRAIDEPEVTRPKGHARLLAFRNAGDHAEPLSEDALVQAGDTIQLRYHGGGQRHGVIASIDGAGAVTLHYPADERASTSLAAKPTSLPNSYTLDDAPRFERFLFLTSEQPLDVRDTLGALRALARRVDSVSAPADLPAHIQQWSFRLRKPDNQKATP